MMRGHDTERRLFTWVQRIYYILLAAVLENHMKLCNVCGNQMTSSTDEELTRDCGGTCLGCKAMAGDPVAVAEVKRLIIKVVFDD